MLKTKVEHLYPHEWGDGPWLRECDKKQWLDEATQLPCLIVRVEDTGAWCGYVGVPLTSKLAGRDYNDPLLEEIKVHGGLTYANRCNGHVCHEAEEEVYWFGFDCAHCDDLMPAMSSMKFPWAVYRDQGYVERQCTKLAAQIRTILADATKA